MRFFASLHAGLAGVVSFAGQVALAVLIAAGSAIAGATIVGVSCVLIAGAASAATVDFMPLASFAWDLFSPMIPPVLIALLLALAPKFPLIATLIHAVDARQLESYIGVAVQGGAARLAPYAQQYSKLDLQSAIAAEAAAWLVDQTPQRLARLGITPDAVLERVLPYVPGHDAYKELVAAAAAPAKAA